MQSIRIPRGSDLAAVLRKTVESVKKHLLDPAVPILLDYLREAGHPKAVALEEIWGIYTRRIEAYAKRDWTRNREWCCASATKSAKRIFVSDAWPVLRAIANSLNAKKPAPNPIEVRANRAAELLAKWERELGIVQRRVAKYRKRVAYYEKKGGTKATI